MRSLLYMFLRQLQWLHILPLHLRCTSEERLSDRCAFILPPKASPPVIRLVHDVRHGVSRRLLNEARLLADCLPPDLGILQLRLSSSASRGVDCHRPGGPCICQRVVPRIRLQLLQLEELHILGYDSVEHLRGSGSYQNLHQSQG